MKILVLGCGIVGSVIIRDLCKTSSAEVDIADIDLERARTLSKEIKGKVLKVDVSNYENVLQALKEGKYDVVINATSHIYNLNVMKAAITTGTNYIDLGGMYYYALEQLKYDEEAEKRGVLALICMGVAPGLTNIFAKLAADELDSVDKVRLYSGTKILKPTRFKLAYSAYSLLDELTKKAVIFRDGKYIEVEPFSEEESIEFPEENIGRVYAYTIIHSEHATLPKTIGKGVREVVFKVIFSQEAVNKLKILKEFGLTDEKPIEVNGVKLPPRRFLEGVLRSLPPVKVEEKSEIHPMRVLVVGKRGDVETRIIYDVINDPKPEWNAGSSAYITGVPASIAAQMIGNGQIQVKGVKPPELCVDPHSMIRELVKRNVRIYKVVEEMRAVES